MDNGVNFGKGVFMSTADLGGQRVLGMSGSLTGYINSGVATPIDTFQVGKNQRKAENKSNFIKAIKLGIVGLAAVCAGAIFIKKGDIKKVQKLATDCATNTIEKLKEPKKIDLTNFKSQMSQAGKSINSAFDKHIIQPIKSFKLFKKPIFDMENIKSKFAKAKKIKIEAPKKSSRKLDLSGVADKPVEAPITKPPKVEKVLIETPKVEASKAEKVVIEAPKVETPKAKPARAKKTSIKPKKNKSAKAKTPKKTLANPKTPKVQNVSPKPTAVEQVAEIIETPKVQIQAEPLVDDVVDVIETSVEQPPKRKISINSVQSKLNLKGYNPLGKRAPYSVRNKF